MGIIVRIILLLGAPLAALLVGREAENYPVVQAMMGLLAAVAVLLGIILLRRR
ncbi:hypothetical protein [Teichococcus rhizosphaerae]|uniref:hypothetical protein n=1 Tax=Teichococcus rhizosphaerae TaxID=1335062 RepID=UPI00159BE7B3|nr:hypothetical protein [Pseudoroseomonas rhizosphaerae]